MQISCCWKLTNGSYLLQGEAVPWPVSAIAVTLPGGQALEHTAEYYLVDAQGAILATYPPPRAYSLEDTLYIYDIVAVTNRRLCRFLWEQRWDSKEITREVGTLLLGLVEYDPDALPFDVTSLRSSQSLNE